MAQGYLEALQEALTVGSNAISTTTYMVLTKCFIIWLFSKNSWLTERGF